MALACLRKLLKPPKRPSPRRETEALTSGAV
jgi:hypothetical protein